MESYTVVKNVTFWISKTRLRSNEKDANAYEVRIGNDTTTEKKSIGLIEANTVCDGFHDGKFSHFVLLLVKGLVKYTIFNGSIT